jgi:hypothetical protein
MTRLHDCSRAADRNTRARIDALQPGQQPGPRRRKPAPVSAEDARAPHGARHPWVGDPHVQRPTLGLVTANADGEWSGASIAQAPNGEACILPAIPELREAGPVEARSDARSQASVRRCNYGIAAVFSLMLIVLVVVGAGLWSV